MVGSVVVKGGHEDLKWWVRVRVNWGIELSSRPVELTAVGS